MPLAAPLLGTAYATGSLTGTHALNVPGGTSSGQRMLVFLAAASGSTVFTPVQSGWTTLYDNHDGAATGSGTRLVVYERVTTSSEPATYSFTSSPLRMVVGQVIVYAGTTTAPTTAIGVTQYSTATTTPTAPSLNPFPYSQARLLYIGIARGINSGEATVDRTAPGPMTERSDTGTVNLTNVNMGFIFADEQLASSSATGTRQGTFASPGTRGFAAAILVYPNDEIVNNPPVADAGADQTGNVNDLIALDGSNSTDVEGIASYAWSQTGGPAVTLSGDTTDTATFTPTEPGTYTFQLVVTDTGSLTDSDDVTVTIYPTGVIFGSFGSTNSTTPTATVPANASVGDLGLLLISTQGNGNDVSLPSGWTPTYAARSASSSTGAMIRGAYKILEAGDIGANVTWTISPSNRWNAVIVVLQDMHALHPVLRSVGNTKLGRPDIDGLAVVGGSGSTAYGYVATAINEAGETIASSAQNTSTGPAVLSSSNYIRVWFDPVEGATNYSVYGRTVGGPYQLIATVDNTNVTGVSTNQKRGISDTGTALTPQNPPAAYPDVVHWDGRDSDNPGRLRTNFAGAIVIHAAALRLGAGASGFALDAPPTDAVFLGQHLHAENQLLLSIAYEELAGSGDLLSGRTSSFNHTTDQWATLSIILRPAAANGTPTSLPNEDRTFFAGDTVYLNGGLSFDVDEDDLTYAWTQTGGPAVTLNDATTATPSFVAPSAATTLTFELTVTDPDGADDTAETVITIVDLPSSANAYKNGAFGAVQFKTYKDGEWV